MSYGRNRISDGGLNKFLAATRFLPDGHRAGAPGGSQYAFSAVTESVPRLLCSQYRFPETAY
jgi:hypothetical protein